MTKTELIDSIAEKLNVRKYDASAIVESVFDSIGKALAKGEKCTFVGFGVFEVKSRAAREGRNPRDPSKPIAIPAKEVPVFRPGKALKTIVSGEGKK